MSVNSVANENSIVVQILIAGLDFYVEFGNEVFHPSRKNKTGGAN
jgi:hypothetical protein